MKKVKFTFIEQTEGGAHQYDFFSEEEAALGAYTATIYFPEVDAQKARKKFLKWNQTAKPGDIYGEYHWMIKRR